MSEQSNLFIAPICPSCKTVSMEQRRPIDKLDPQYLLNQVQQLTLTVNELKTINNRLFIENEAMTTDLKMMNEQLDRFLDVMLYE